MLIFGTDNVSAQTPTWEPLYKTPTPAPTTDTTCYGSPVGWGYVTPDAAWEMNCSSCLPSSNIGDWSEFPASDYDGTATPSAGQTTTPTVTSTPGVTYWIYYDIYSTTFYNATNYGWVTAYSEQIPLPVVPGNTVQGVLLKETDFHCQNGICSNAFGVGMNGYMSTGELSLNVMTCVNINNGNNGCTALGYSSYRNTNADKAYNYIQFNENMHDPANNPLTVTIGYIGFIMYGTPVSKPVPTQTPTPSGYESWQATATAVAGGGSSQPYCSIVQPAPLGDDFALPTPLLGSNSCFTVGGFTISIGWVSNIASAVGFSIPEDITVPGLQVCLREISFGSIDIVGVKIDLDILAFAMGAVLILRVIWRS